MALLKNIRYLVLDVDGTLTDGKIYMGTNGEVLKAFNIKDGYGIHDLLPLLGVTPVIITGRQSQIVLNRCRELGIQDVFQGVGKKEEVLLNYLEKRHASLDEVAYIGDDLNDLPCMQKVKEGGGITVAPSDAVKSIRDFADYICTQKGGEGAVREFVDWLSNEEQ